MRLATISVVVVLAGASDVSAEGGVDHRPQGAPQISIDLSSPDGRVAARLNGDAAATLRPVRDVDRDGRDELSRVLGPCLQTFFGQASFPGVSQLPSFAPGTGMCGCSLGPRLIAISNWCPGGEKIITGSGGGSFAAAVQGYPCGPSSGLLLSCGQASDVRRMGDLSGDGVDDLWLGGYTVNAGYFMPGSATFGACAGTVAFCTGGSQVLKVGGLSPEAYRLGDVDGDGFVDLGFTDGSSVYVLAGVQGAIRASGDLPTDAAFIVQRPAGVTASVSDVVGDFDLNGDGYSDIAIGFGDADVGGVSRAGVVVVVYGAPGRSGVIDPSQASQGVSAILVGSAQNEAVGSKLAAIVDLSGDGRGDLLVARSGTVLPVVLGAAQSLAVGPQPVNAVPHLSLALPSVAVAAAVTADARHDFNGDGRDDLFLTTGGNSLWLVLDARTGDLFKDGFEPLQHR